MKRSKLQPILSAVSAISSAGLSDKIIITGSTSLLLQGFELQESRDDEYNTFTYRVVDVVDLLKEPVIMEAIASTEFAFTDPIGLFLSSQKMRPKYMYNESYAGWDRICITKEITVGNNKIVVEDVASVLLTMVMTFKQDAKAYYTACQNNYVISTLTSIGRDTTNFKNMEFNVHNFLYLLNTIPDILPSDYVELLECNEYSTARLNRIKYVWDKGKDRIVVNKVALMLSSEDAAFFKGLIQYFEKPVS